MELSGKVIIFDSPEEATEWYTEILRKKELKYKGDAEVKQMIEEWDDLDCEVKKDE
jgi:hypothetical protein